MSDKFKPQDHLTDMKGKQYLEVKWRLVWFKDENPKGSVITEVLSPVPALVKATVYIDGVVIATGHGSAAAKGNAVWSGREIEKAETAAIGRALAHAGYGTQFTDDDESNLSDSPVEKPQKSDAERKAKATKTFSDLKARGLKVGYEVASMDASWSIEKMMDHYKEQLALVTKAEKEAK